VVDWIRQQIKSVQEQRGCNGGGGGGKGGAQRSCLRANEPKNMVARCADNALMVYS
jgi:hypothetical protein